ncbi:MAG: hypothetical protein U0W24_17350 [Bacteroidales bacterium]
MENLILNMIENLTKRKNFEIHQIEEFKQKKLHDLILITSGKIMELENIIQNLSELIEYNAHLNNNHL